MISCCVGDCCLSVICSSFTQIVELKRFRACKTSAGGIFPSAPVTAHRWDHRRGGQPRTAASITFTSWRTLPGQLAAISRFYRIGGKRADKRFYGDRPAWRNRWFCQQRNIFRTLRQRRDLEIHHVRTVVAESSRNSLRAITFGRVAVEWPNNVRTSISISRLLPSGRTLRSWKHRAAV